MADKKERHERIITVLLRKIEESNGAEADNARKALERLCEKYDLTIEDVLGKQDERVQRTIEYKRSKQIVAQIIRRYGNNNEIYENTHWRVFYVDLTDAEHLEVMHAIDILVPLFRKELRKIQDVALHAFVNKHDLFYKGEVEEDPERIGEEEPKTLEQQREELARRMQIGAMVETMEDAVIHKRLN